MEEVKAYIESGILELYVLGDVSHEEKLQVEAMASKHSAVKAELAAIERSLELFAGEHKIEPPPALRNRVLNSLLTNLADDNTFHTKAPTGYDASVVPISKSSGANFYKYAFAACLALLLVSVAAMVNMYNKLQTSSATIAALNTSNQHFSKTVSMQNDQLTIFHDTAYKIITLPGTGKTPTASMSLAWSPTKKKVIIDMASLNLPQNDKDHQYQLWAIVAGKPVDLGVFDTQPLSEHMMKVMKSVTEPQAFAVTLEPRGGSVNPTMANMTVITTRI